MRRVCPLRSRIGKRTTGIPVVRRPRDLGAEEKADAEAATFPVLVRKTKWTPQVRQ